METLVSIVVTALAYFISLSIYRLYFHPLSGFPGPKLAAITRYFEAYYDLVQNGQYTFKIREMHRKYGKSCLYFPNHHISRSAWDAKMLNVQGPIIRISPYELHIDDPSFSQDLYRRDGRWNKYDWSSNAFTVPGSTVCTADHYTHKMRRAPLNSFFSKAAIVSRQSIIYGHVEKLCERIDQCARTESGIKLGSALSAFTADVASEFLLGKPYGNLDREDFNTNMTQAVQGAGTIWRITKHFPWFGPVLRGLPKPLVEMIGDRSMKAFLAFVTVSTPLTPPKSRSRQTPRIAWK